MFDFITPKNFKRYHVKFWCLPPLAQSLYKYSTLFGKGSYTPSLLGQSAVQNFNDWLDVLILYAHSVRLISFFLNKVNCKASLFITKMNQNLKK